jgi:CubicO group peptidase (beta-lactamase class C family)
MPKRKGGIMLKARAIIGAIVGAIIVTGAVAQTASVPLAPTEVQGPAVPSSPAVEFQLPDTPPPQLNAQDVNAWLDGFLPYALGRADIPGAVVAVVRDGQFLALKGYGYSNVEKRIPVDPRTTMFRPGSVSKLFIWTALMQQVERGKLDLNADVNQYLDFKIPELEGKPVTLANLMTHTAGFEEQVKDIITTDADNVIDYETLLKRWVPERVYAPGSTPAYSNYATSLAGYIVQRVSGQPLETYIERNIFEPLGMRHSSFRQPLPDNLKPLMSEGYQSGKDKPYGFEFIGPWPAGSLSSTAEDMGRFMIAHLQNGGPILSPATARLMHSRLNLPIEGLSGMAHGFYEAGTNGRRVIAHGGDTVAFHSDLNLFLDDGTGMFVSFNSGGKEGATTALRAALVDEFADRYFPAPADNRRLDEKAARESARKLAGLYSTSRRSHSSFLDITSLFGQEKVSVDDKGRPVVPIAGLLSTKTRDWVAVSPTLWRDANSDELIGAVVKDGEVVRFSVGALAPIMVWDRVPTYRSSAWILPLLYFALAVLVLTALLWPARAVVRRRFGASLGLEKTQLRSYRASRLAAVLILLVLAGWAGLITVMFGDISNLTSSFDPLLYILQALSFIVFFGGVAAAAWYAYTAWRSGLRWTAKVWSILLLIAAAVVLYVALVFNLIGWSANY